MAIAHVCTACGNDLARIRVARDPHYGLPLVRCPRCGVHAVRRTHPLLAGFRRVRRVDWSLTVLLVQVILLAAFGLLWILLIPTLAAQLAELAPARQARANAEVAYVVAVLAVGTGTWLRASFSHFRFHRAWLTWLLIVAVGMAAACVLRSCDGVIWLYLGGDTARARMMLDAYAREELLALLVRCAPAVAILAVGAWIGKPIGDLILWSLRWMRRSLWRHRRRMRRKTLVAA